MDIRRFGAAYRSPSYTYKRIRETYETYYDIRYPAHERSAGPAAPRLRRQPLAPRARRRLRREIGLGAGQLVRAERRRAATRSCGRAAGRGRTGRRRSAPSTAPAASAVAIFDESSFAKLEIEGPGAADFLEGLCDNRVARGVGADHLHPDAEPARRDRVRLHRRAARRGALRDRHRHRLRQPRPRMDAAPPARRRQRADRRRHLGVGLLRDLGTAGARRAAAADPGRPRERGLPLHDACGRSRSATCRCGRSASPTSASSAGSSTARPSTGSGCGGRSGRRAASTASSPAATGRSTRCGWRRATASGAPTSPPTRRPTKAGSASA